MRPLYHECSKSQGKVGRRQENRQKYYIFFSYELVTMKSGWKKCRGGLAGDYFFENVISV